MSTPSSFKIFPLAILPGIQRDGTQFSSRSWIYGQWCRMYNGVPRKMGGYIQSITTPNVPRGTFFVLNSPNINVYIGDFQFLKYYTMNNDGQAISGLIDRTPVLFNSNLNNLWSFDLMYSDVSNASVLIAYASSNLNAIDSPIESPIYYGNALDNSPLIETGQSVSGGIVALHPYLIMFGNSGTVSISNANDPTTLLIENARVTANKIVFGLPVRGGNSSPAGLLWSLDSLIRMTFVGSPLLFAFDTISSSISVLSSRSIIEYDGTYYWIGNNKFYLYSGTVLPLPNSRNSLYFFDNLNFSQRQKVWATKNSRFDEIWWHYPSGNSTECDSVIIYNVKSQDWYDTGNITRGCGYSSDLFQFPVWVDNTPDGGGNYSVWVHENGFDKIVGNTATAIQSYIESSYFSFPAFDLSGNFQGIDRWSYLYRMEPDIIQSGDLMITINGRDYPRSAVVSDTYTLTDMQEKLDVETQRREMTIRFESNTIGGFFHLGLILLVIKVGDARQ
jgi:hypothetical protein